MSNHKKFWSVFILSTIAWLLFINFVTVPFINKTLKDINFKIECSNH